MCKTCSFRPCYSALLLLAPRMARKTRRNYKTIPASFNAADSGKESVRSPIHSAFGKSSYSSLNIHHVIFISSMNNLIMLISFILGQSKPKSVQACNISRLYLQNQSVFPNCILYIREIYYLLTIPDMN